MSKVKLLKEMAEDAENARVNAIIELATEESGEFNKKLFAELLVREFCEECRMISKVLDQRKEQYWRDWMYEDGFDSVIGLCTSNVMKRFGLRRERGSKGKKKYK